MERDTHRKNTKRSGERHRGYPPDYYDAVTRTSPLEEVLVYQAADAGKIQASSRGDDQGYLGRLRAACFRRASQYAFMRSEAALRAAADMPLRRRWAVFPALRRPGGRCCKAAMARSSLSRSAISRVRMSLIGPS